MKTGYISFPFRARYQQLGEISPQTEEIVYVIHGYGQLSQYFIRKFSAIQSDSRIIIAPEGLSRFYLAGFDGRIGATWMTREDRENDILNYVSYLNAMHEQVMEECSKSIRITVIGFSQGAATATRWLMAGEVPASRLILWAGILPYDLDISNAHERLGAMEKHIVYGTDDPYLNDAKMKEMTDLAGRTGLSFEYHTFDGKHDIDPEKLKVFFER